VWDARYATPDLCNVVFGLLIWAGAVASSVTATSSRSMPRHIPPVANVIVLGAAGAFQLLARRADTTLVDPVGAENLVRTGQAACRYS